MMYFIKELITTDWEKIGNWYVCCVTDEGYKDSLLWLGGCREWEGLNDGEGT